MKTNYREVLFLIILGIAYGQCTFVHQVASNEFNININEQGAKITQSIRFENGLKITDVPDHHHRSASTFVFDKETVIISIFIILAFHYCNLL